MQVPKRQNTKTALLCAAERLFAERGLGNVTSKDILRAAGARNESALQYHFGDMHALMRQVFGTRFEKIEQARLARFDELDAKGKGDDFEAVILASTAPYFESCVDEDGRLYARFCVQFATDPSFSVEALVDDIKLKSLVSLRKRLNRCLGHVPEAALNTRLRLGFTVSLIQVADYAREIENGHARPLDVAIQEAVESLCGFLNPLPANWET